MTIYVGQEYVTLRVNIGIAIPLGATDKRLYYRKPDGTTGFWPITTTEDKTFVYELQPGDISTIGVWYLQASMVVDGRQAIGIRTAIKVIATIF